MKLWLKRLALLGFTLLLALLLAEFVVRLTIYVPRGTPYVAENPDTVYFNKPNISGRHISPGEFNCQFKTNSHGFRSAELGAKQAAVPRILCLGDSFTFGVGANDPESWPAQLEARLSVLGKKTEVVNAGVMGWGLAEYWIWASLHAGEVASNLIVVGCHASDWDNAISNGLVSLEADGTLRRHQVIRKDVSKLKSIADHIPFYDTLMTHSAIASLLKQTVVSISKRGTTGGLSKGAKDAVSLVEKAAPINKAVLSELKQVAADSGAGLLIVFIPSHGEMKAAGDSDADYRRFRELMPMWTQALSIPYLDATPLLREHLEKGSLPVSAFYHVTDGHCTPSGYRVIAEGIAAAITQHPEWLANTGNSPTPKH